MIVNIYARLTYAYPPGDIFGPSPHLDIYRSMGLEIDLKALSLYARDNIPPAYVDIYDEERLLSKYLTDNRLVFPKRYWYLNKTLAREIIDVYDIEPKLTSELASKEIPLYQVEIYSEYYWRHCIPPEPSMEEKEEVFKSVMQFLK